MHPTRIFGDGRPFLASFVSGLTSLLFVLWMAAGTAVAAEPIPIAEGGGATETAEDFRWWKLRNKVAYPNIRHGHNLVNTVPPAKYLAEHPEYYAIVAGERKTSQLCTSNPEVIRLSIEHVNEFFDANPDVLSYSLCPDDNEQYCECARDRRPRL